MKNIWNAIQSKFTAMSVATRIALAVSTAALILVSVVAARRAAQPSFELLYSGLDGREVGAVQSALAAANVRYRVSQPPGPFLVHVDEDQYYVAQNAVALAGALTRAPEGISAGSGGAAEVF